MFISLSLEFNLAYNISVKKNKKKKKSIKKNLKALKGQTKTNLHEVGREDNSTKLVSAEERNTKSSDEHQKENDVPLIVRSRNNESKEQDKKQIENESISNDDFEWEEVDKQPRLFKRIVSYLLLFILLVSIPIGIFLRHELKTSEFQAKYFHSYAQKLTAELKSGEGMPYPAPKGPYDKRLGYSDLPLLHENLKKNSFSQTSHVEVSQEAIDIANIGLTYPYRAKTQSGLKIIGQNDQAIFNFTEPNWIFPSFESISPLILNSLLFIEDRSLLDKKNVMRNPAVEWDRFFKALMDLVMDKLISERKVPGGSTLATQVEKFRHSSGGRTSSPKDKIQQMISASLKAYNKSENTIQSRQKIALDYINSVPLAALPGYGEIHGLGDGLWAYFGEDPRKINEILRQSPSELDEERMRAKGRAFKQVLSLFLAHRRPSDYLDDNPQQLQLQVEKYLPIFFKEGIISYPLYKASLAENTPYRRILPKAHRVPYASRKGPSVVRTHLLNILGIGTLYELDRLDLKVNSTLNLKVQEEVTRFLLSLQEPDAVRTKGLDGFRLLSTSGDPKKVIYSLTLFEHQDGVNKLRVQTDTYDQPFNINEGVKLDLGSTAKFRTIITYLEVIEEIYLKFSKMEKKELKEEIASAQDPLTKWALPLIMQNSELSLEDLLRKAMERTYSANPGERFFTAGGMHTFENFKKEDNGRTVSMNIALRHSINLPFIRLMRDIVRYYSFNTKGSSARTLKEMSTEMRTEYLERFADKEGKIFLGRFYDKYKGKTPDEIIAILMDSVRKKPSRFASIYWFLFPDADIDSFITFMKKHIDHAALNEKDLRKYYDWYSIRAKTLGDKGYLAKMHPLELWLAAYLIQHPGSSLTDIFNESKSERVEVYDWLMKTTRKHAQDSRIKIILEAEAFTEIHQKWKKLGYPLPSLVPSYATSLGTSADRPDALAELMGIVLNDGIRFPKTSIDALTFGEGTPYESSFEFNPRSAERVLSSEVAKVARDGLFDVVSNGTAIRLKDGLKTRSEILPIGGKTGTGDHRYVVYRGGVKEKRVVNRTATFMFVIGNRFYGVVSAFVPGQEAAQFKFTSALPVQILKILTPALEELVSNE